MRLEKAPRILLARNDNCIEALPIIFRSFFSSSFMIFLDRTLTFLALPALLHLTACERTLEEQPDVFLDPEVENGMEVAAIEELSIFLSRGSERTCDLKLTGEIDRENASALATEILRFANSGLGNRSNELSATLCLNSPGGEIANARTVEAAIEVAREKGFGIKTLVKAGDSCLSACALIFMSGFDCLRQFCNPSRSMSSRATLGFHTPFFGLESLEGGDRFLAATYEGAIRDLGDFMLLGRDSTIPSFLLAEILRTPSDEFFYIDTIAKVLAAEIEVFDIRQAPVTSDTIHHYCANHYAVEDGLEKVAYTNYFYGLRIGTEEIQYGTTFDDFEAGGEFLETLGGQAGSVESFAETGDEAEFRPTRYWHVDSLQYENRAGETIDQSPFLMVHHQSYAWDFNLIYTCIIHRLEVYFSEYEAQDIQIPDGVSRLTQDYEAGILRGNVSSLEASKILNRWLANDDERWIYTWPAQTLLTELR